MTVTSGQRWLPLLKNYVQDSSLAKTCAVLLTSHWGSSAAFLTWKASATKPSHLLFQLAVNLPRTEGTGAGLWPTATTRHRETSPEHWLERREKFQRGESNFNPGLQLETAAMMWPTPNASDSNTANMKDDHDVKRGYLRGVVKMWPTPTASDHKGSGPTVIRKDGKNRLNDRLDYATEQRQQGSGQLNPTWVEWLMGYPEDGMERVSVGVKDRAARLRALGNSVVPQVAEQIFRAILEGWDQ